MLCLNCGYSLSTASCKKYTLALVDVFSRATTAYSPNFLVFWIILYAFFNAATYLNFIEKFIESLIAVIKKRHSWHKHFHLSQLPLIFLMIWVLWNIIVEDWVLYRINFIFRKFLLVCHLWSFHNLQSSTFSQYLIRNLNLWNLFLKKAYLHREKSYRYCCKLKFYCYVETKIINHKPIFDSDNIYNFFLRVIYFNLSLLWLNKLLWLNNKLDGQFSCSCTLTKFWFLYL